MRKNEIMKLTKNIKYIILVLLISVITFAVYLYFISPNKTVGVSKEKVLLGDEKEYDLDIVLNSILNNQFTLQKSIEEMNKQINLLKENDNNQSE